MSDNVDNNIPIKGRRQTFIWLGGLESHNARANIISIAILTLIILSCISIALESVDAVRERFGLYLGLFEAFTVAAFSIEYLARVWSCVESPKYSHPFWGRAKFIFSPMAIIDLLAILPFFLTYFVTDMRFLRALRIVRIFRILKLVRYSKALRTFGKIAAMKKEELIITAVLATVLIFMSSALMYFAEREAQPDKFSDIPSALWWAVVTLTTVGYGDVTPITTLGKFLNGIIAVIGIGMFALPAGIIGSALVVEEIFGKGKRGKMENHYVLCGLGKIGVQVLEQLKKLGKDVVVVERDQEGQYIPTARSLDVDVVFGDIRMNETLEEAQIDKAQCIITLSDDDTANLEAALNARAVNKDIRIILRVFDHQFASKIRHGFDVQNAFSPSSLAAPAFAMAAVDPSVVGSFYVGEDLMLNLEITVNKGSTLDSMDTMDFENRGNYSILAHESLATGKRSLHVSESMTILAGDKLVICTQPDYTDELHRLNIDRIANT